MKLIVGLAAMLAAGRLLAAEGFVLVDEGQPLAQIVIGAQPPESVVFAAMELRNYVRKMSGADLPVHDRAESGRPAIRLGPAALDVLATDALAGVRRDGYLIEIHAGDLCIAGIDDRGPHADIAALLEAGITHDVAAWNFHRGTLYGVYRLLEELGVRWYMPGAFGERVPARRTLEFSGRMLENPHFITRTVSYWSLGVGVNFRPGYEKLTILPGEREAIGFTPVENRMWELRMRGESFRIPLNHNPARTRWFERFGGAHPDYFALLPDGTRDLRSHGHLCYTHPEVDRENIADIRAYAAGQDAHDRGIMTDFAANRNWHPAIALGDYYSLLPNDGFRACTCPGCLAMVPPDVKLVNQRYSKLVWDFVARCAAAVPEVNIVCLAYGTYSLPYPGMTRLPPNVVVGFCAGGFSTPSALYYKDAFERYEKLLEEWAALTHGNLAFWQHYLAANRGEETFGMPEHTPEMYARTARTMARYGNHVFCEMMADSIMFELYNRYLLLKLFYDPQLDERALWRDFLNGFYGPEAGPVVGEIYADIGRLNVKKVEQRAGRIDYWTRLFTPDVVAAYHVQADAAMARAAGTRFAPAVEAFKSYYLGLMDAGRAHFESGMGATLHMPNPAIASPFVENPPLIDGAPDDPAWAAAVPVGMCDLATGEPSDLATEVRTVHDDEFVYFLLTARDPDAAALRRVTGEPGTVDGVEIFLDTENKQQGYYQMTFDLAGRLDERHYPDRIEPARLDWRSHAQWRIEVGEDRYVVEIALPRAALDAAGRDLAGESWGVLVGRTIAARQTGAGRFHCTSRIMRRRFHQPALFNQMRFER